MEQDLFYLNTKLSNSLETYEKNFYTKIIPLFPFYEKFWEAFIGQRVFYEFDEKQSPRIRFFEPYELVFKSSIATTARGQIETIYRHIAMFHYGLFCRLSSILEIIEQLDRMIAKEPTTNEQIQIGYREAFQAGLSNFGNLNNYLCELWNAVIKMKLHPDGLEKRIKPEELCTEINRHFGLNYSDQAKQLMYIIEARGFADHHAQYPFYEHNGTYLVPKCVRSNETWRDIHAQDKSTWVNATDFIKKAFKEMVSFLNETNAGLCKIFPGIHGRFFDFVKQYQHVCDVPTQVKTWTCLSSSSAIASGDGMPGRG